MEKRKEWYSCFFLVFNLVFVAPILKLRLNSERALEGPSGGGTLNMNFFIPRVRTRDAWEWYSCSIVRNHSYISHDRKVDGIHNLKD